MSSIYWTAVCLFSQAVVALAGIIVPGDDVDECCGSNETLINGHAKYLGTSGRIWLAVKLYMCEVADQKGCYAVGTG